MASYFILLLSFSILTGCKEESAPSPSAPVPDSTLAPNAMTYPESNIQLRVQVEMSPIYPTYYGSFIDTFEISPALPNGLHFSEQSGRITGTPEVLQPSPVTYTITGRNDKGSTSFQVSLSIIAQSPFGIVYPYEQFSIIKGTTQLVSLIPFSNPGIRGGAKITQFTISPTLPAGMTFDSSSGAIEGYPSGGSQALSEYTITGTNTGGSTSATIKIAVESEVMSIVAGGKHSCAIVDDKVKCWGDNTYGQLGNNTTINSLIPVPTQGVTGNVEKVSLGSEYSCLVNHLGRASCWGRNHQNQFGPNVSGNKLVATPLDLGIVHGMSVSLSGLDNANSKNHACFTKIDTSELLCYGEFSFGNLNADSNLVKTNSTTNYLSPRPTHVSGGDFMCVLEQGVPKCFGNNSLNQLGDNGVSGSFSRYLTSSLLTNSFEIAAGTDFACAIVTDNFGEKEVQCWGSNSNSQLGDLSNLNISSGTPVKVKGVPGDAVALQFLTLGNKFGCMAINRQAHCWGDNTYGQLGTGQTGGAFEMSHVIKLDGTPLQNVTSISAGEFHACAISDNKAYCWGRNDKGQLGTNSTSNSNRAVLVNSAINN